MPERRESDCPICSGACRETIREAPNSCVRCAESRHFLRPTSFVPFMRGALSRREPIPICDVCARTEALQDMEGALNWEQARIAMQNEFDENIRLPKGMALGIYKLGGGIHIGADDFDEQAVMLDEGESQ